VIEPQNAFPSQNTYDSAAAQLPAVSELRELWRYRDLLRLLVANRIKTRYKRSALGVVWTLLNPLLTTLVLTIAFSYLLRFELKNYPIYLLVGLLFWNFFNQTTNDAMHTLIWGSSLIKRIYVPRAVFAVAVTGNGLINFLFALIPLLVIMLGFHHPIRPTLLLLPVAILLMSMFTLGFSLLVSTLAVFFVDFVDLLGVILSAWFYLTPIIYPATIIPEKYLPFIQLNPLNNLLGLFRSLIYLGEIPAPLSWLKAAVIASVTLAVGWWIFTRKVDEFAYRI
jgi:ABC-type polysaccharide/polyol phosphate export permease